MTWVKLKDMKKAEGRWSNKAPPITFYKDTLYFVDEDVYESYMVETRKPVKDAEGNHKKDKAGNLLYNVETTNALFIEIPEDDLPDGTIGRKKSLPPLPKEGAPAPKAAPVAAKAAAPAPKPAKQEVAQAQPRRVRQSAPPKAQDKPAVNDEKEEE